MVIYGLQNLKKIFRTHKPSDIFVVTSKSIAARQQRAIREIKKYSGVPVRVVFVPDGEKAKQFRELEVLLKQFIHHRVAKGSIVVAMGGGSVGDLVGFAAHIYMRSIRYIQIPTTLLACVDSSIGGKNGIDFGGYKNNIGSVYMPIATCIDERFLTSLPRDQWISGLGEVVKAGLIADPSILRILERASDGIQKNPKMLRDLVRRSVRVKERIVTKDPAEHSLRRALNFGHTVGHAVELTNNMSHGMSVLYGMWTELCIQKDLGCKYQEPLEALERFFTLYRVHFSNTIKIDYAAISRDKKVVGDTLYLPIVERVGSVRIVKVPLRKYLALVRKATS